MRPPWDLRCGTVGGANSLTDWITAAAALIGAVGTVSAVWFAVTQSRRAVRTSLDIECWQWWTDELAAISVRVTNRGIRMVRLDVEPIFIGCTPSRGEVAVGGTMLEDQDTLPARLDEGGTVEFSFDNAKILDQVHFAEEVTVMYLMLCDQFGRWFYAPFPGVRMHDGWWRRSFGKKPKFDHARAGVSLTAH